ncbi:MAG: 4'-phosphopantetheinyl transferase superfamily protein [Candidatus Latescibacteria bacterium]|nr:4'-phosphopantetheinyl transferase superfamily protein [Candidatus Latescibacterota bacterium]
MPDSPWHLAPDRPTLTADQVHVWRCDLEQHSTQLATWTRLLSPDESQRAASFRSNPHRARYIVARGFLRYLLGLYLQRDPAQIEFAYNPQGKPELAPPAAPPLHFNLSHSHNLALYALTRDRLVGVDLEFIRPRVSIDQIARRFLAPAEQDALQAISPADRTRAFFTCWTRKEAYLKARGEGIMRGLDRFAVSLQPNAPALLSSPDDEPAEQARWRFADLQPGSGFLGALCAEGQWQLRCYQWRAK